MSSRMASAGAAVAHSWATAATTSGVGQRRDRDLAGRRHRRHVADRIGAGDGAARSGSTSLTVTLWPSATRLAAIAPLMFPSPMTPTQLHAPSSLEPGEPERSPITSRLDTTVRSSLWSAAPAAGRSRTGFFTIPDDPGEPPRLLGSRCPACGEDFFPRRVVCAQCLARGHRRRRCSAPRAASTPGRTCHVPLFAKKDGDVAGYGVGQVDLPEGPRVQAILLGGPDDFEIGMELELDLETLREDADGDEVVIYRFRRSPTQRGASGAEVRGRRRRRHRHGPVRHATRDRSTADLARDAGLAALHDAGMTLADVDEAFVGYIQPGVDARRQGDEGARAHRPAGHPHRERVGHRARGVPRGGVGGGVGPGRRRHGARLRQDDRHGPRRRASRGTGRDQIDRTILPAAYFALWAQRRMHERGTTPEHFAAIAAKNWNYGALNPLQRPPARPRRHGRGGARLAHGGRAAHHDDVLPGRRRRRLRDRAPRPSGCARHQPDRRLVRPIASALQSETYAPGHTFVGPVVGPATMTRDTARAGYEDAGLGPEDVNLALCHDAFANEELEYYELLGFCAEGEAEKLRRGGRDRARRPHPVQHRRRPHRPRPPRRADRARHGPRDRAAAARRGRRPPGRRARRRRWRTSSAAAASARSTCSRPTDRGGADGRRAAGQGAARSRPQLWPQMAHGPTGAFPAAKLAPDFYRYVAETAFGMIWSPAGPGGPRPQPGHVSPSSPRSARPRSCRPTCAGALNVGISHGGARRGADADGRLRRRARRQRGPQGRRRRARHRRHRRDSEGK